MNNLIGFLLLMIVSIFPIMGQNSSQTKISGSVIDQNDAVVVGARVFLFNSITLIEKTTNTDSSGTFTFDNVTPGNYEIRVAAEGFSQNVRALQVTTAGISNLEIALAIGESNVSVSAEIGRAENVANVPQAVSVIGREEFIAWVKEKFLNDEHDGEAPAVRVIKRHGAKDDIIRAIVLKTGKALEEIKTEKGALRQITMDVLYRQGGMTNPEIGKLFGVDYSAVSQERRRLRSRIEKDRKVRALLHDLEANLSMIEK